MKRRLIVKDSTVADIDSIYWYSVETWGRLRARAYLEGLESLFDLLVNHPEIARKRFQTNPPVRLHRYKSHMVIFTADDDLLEIIRVVHARSDWQALLAE